MANIIPACLSPQNPAAGGPNGYQINIGRGAAGEYCGGLVITDKAGKPIWLAKGDEADTIRKQLDWNNLQIRAEGGHITVHLNHQKVVDYIDPNPDPRYLQKGVLALQTYGRGKAMPVGSNSEISRSTRSPIRQQLCQQQLTTNNHQLLMPIRPYHPSDLRALVSRNHHRHIRAGFHRRQHAENSGPIRAGGADWLASSKTRSDYRRLPDSALMVPS